MIRATTERAVEHTFETPNDWCNWLYEENHDSGNLVARYDTDVELLLTLRKLQEVGAGRMGVAQARGEVIVELWSHDHYCAATGWAAILVRKKVPTGVQPQPRRGHGH
jgi:hypothetical protein